MYIEDIDWKKRMTSLKRLKGLMLGGVNNFDNFFVLYAKLYPHLTA